MADGKWVTDVPPGLPARGAARVVLSARLEAVRRVLPLAAGYAHEDAEHVHQLRVGTRRAAAALRVFADWLPEKRVGEVKEGLRALRKAAGSARDWDMFIHGLAAREDAAREFLLGYALGQRAAAQERVVGAMTDTGPAFVKASTALPGRVRKPRSRSSPATFGELAVAHVGGVLADFTADVRADPTTPADLHRVRIEAKRVRYAIELFAGCFTPPLREVIYPAVEAAQEQLGGLQDAAVGIEHLTVVADRAGEFLPGVWPRLAESVTVRLADLRERLAAGPALFAAWREEWERVTAEHPLGSLHPSPSTGGA